MSYVPKYILKRMFPKDKALQVVNFEGEEWVQLTVVNVISPLDVPEGKIDLGGYTLEKVLGEYFTLKVNNVLCPVTPDTVNNDLFLWNDGKKLTFKGIVDEGAAGGMVIAVGSMLRGMIRKSVFPAEVQEMLKDGTPLEITAESTLGGAVSVTVKVVTKVTGDFQP